MVIRIEAVEHRGLIRWAASCLRDLQMQFADAAGDGSVLVAVAVAASAAGTLIRVGSEVVGQLGAHGVVEQHFEKMFQTITFLKNLLQ